MNDMAKVFWTGRSQAVRLPKEYRFDTDEVRIHREGDRIVLQPAARNQWAWLDDLEQLDSDAAAAALDRPGADALPEGAVFN